MRWQSSSPPTTRCIRVSRIIADDRLAGAPREAVQARLDLWLKTHIEKLLGPLFGLSKAEDITGIGRGIAFQLVEALGVLERAKISAEMKDLDQASRATLRKYGVRFGAYHIYFPGLLKPAARALASLLWAEKQDNVDMSALSGAQHLASSGRTSFPVDKALHRDAYRLLGYRQCGERAVRVDILERLADLIRPALAWRETSPGEKPTGAFDGRGFVVTQAMTSLTGSAGEDFASILRALGYRMEKRPPLPPKPAPVEVVETVSAETPPVEASAEATSETPAEEVAAEVPVSSEPVSSASLLPNVTPVPVASEEPRLWSRPQLSRPRRRKPRSRTRLRNRRRSRWSAPPKLRPSPPPRAKLLSNRKLRRNLLKPNPLKLLLRKPSPMRRRPSRNSSRSGGPVAVPRSAVRITTATASAITDARPKARQQPWLAKAPRAHRASSAIAVVAATTSFVNPARARRRMLWLLRRRPRARRRLKRVRSVRRVSASRARAATMITAATSSIATRATATRVVAATRASAAAVISADATRAASAIAAPRTVNGRPARRRASATVRSIPIRHLQNWRR